MTVPTRTASTLALVLLLALAACEAPHKEHTETAPPTTAESGKQIAESPDAPAKSTECDPLEVARNKVGVGQEIAPGNVQADHTNGVSRATVEAGVGGPAHMQGAPWLYIDLDTGEKLELGDAAAFEDSRWDIALKNSLIRINGGDSGPGQWKMKAAGSPTWKQDDFVADDCELETYGAGFPMTAFGRWYDYEPKSHRVSAPDDAVYLLRDSSDDRTLKLEILAYDKGTYQLRWNEVDSRRR